MTNHPRPKVEAIRKLRQSPNVVHVGHADCTCDPSLNQPEDVEKRGWLLNEHCSVHGGNFD